MVKDDIGPKASGETRILDLPLPAILAEMDENIRKAAEAALKAAVAEATARMEEARRAAEEAARQAKAAADMAAEASRKAEEAMTKASQGISADLVKRVFASWQFLAFLILIVLGSVFAATAFSLGLSQIVP